MDESHNERWLLSCRRGEAFQNNVANDGPHMPIILYNNMWLRVQDASYTRGQLMGLAKHPKDASWCDHLWRAQSNVETCHSQLLHSSILQTPMYPNLEVFIFHPELQRSSFVWLISKLFNCGTQHNSPPVGNLTSSYKWQVTVDVLQELVTKLALWWQRDFFSWLLQVLKQKSNAAKKYFSLIPQNFLMWVLK